MSYNPWPLGCWHEQFKRPEIDDIRKLGYLTDDQDDSYAVDVFEEEMAKFLGAPYAVAVDSCTNAIYLAALHTCGPMLDVQIPLNTYISVPMALTNAGLNVELVPRAWIGHYRIIGTNIVDAAMQFRPWMYVGGLVMCLSFQYKKRIPIGKGGMILTDDKVLANHVKMVAYEGRTRHVPYEEDKIEAFGFNMYMTPEDAARGLLILDAVKESDGPWDDIGGSENYPPLTNFPAVNVIARVKEK
jgi:dTDP-4-amino-4,6-dideoxygalactose transaminase